MLGIGIGLPFSSLKPFEPSDIGELQMHLSSSVGVFPAENNSAVLKWNDARPGSDINVAQSNVGGRPILTTIGVGAPYITFSGAGATGQGLTFQNGNSTFDMTLTVANGYCVTFVFAAVDYSLAPLGKTILRERTSNQNEIGYFARGGTDVINLKANNNSTELDVAGEQLINNKLVVFMLNVDAEGVVQLYVDNAVSEDQPTNAQNLVLNQLGALGSTTMNGKFKELIIYNKHLSDSERTEVYNYLSPLT